MAPDGGSSGDDVGEGNADPEVIEGFGREWQRFDQRRISSAEAQALFMRYFGAFPWESLPTGACGFDAGTGSGRWARFVAPRVAALHCIDASRAALHVAEATLADCRNCHFHLATIDRMPLADASMDFGYSIGVLHHVPDTMSALRACVRTLKPGAPFLLYLYYSFDNRPRWFKAIWRASDVLRALLSRCPFPIKCLVCDLIAVGFYLPLARTARLAERLGLPITHFPLAAYRAHSLYVMRTDALDRLGTRLEKRFSRDEMRRMMEEAGLIDIRFQDEPPYWVATGRARMR
jgi:ubiquinone/menaquinone biosynthesis C-methylase UbiE